MILFVYWNTKTKQGKSPQTAICAAKKRKNITKQQVFDYIFNNANSAEKVSCIPNFLFCLRNMNIKQIQIDGDEWKQIQNNIIECR